VVQNTAGERSALPYQPDKVLRNHHKEETEEQCLSEGMGIQSVKLKLNYMAKQTKKPMPMTGAKTNSSKLQVPPQGSPIMKKGGKVKMKGGKC